MGVLRVLESEDLADLIPLLDRAPDAYTVASERVAASGLDPVRAGGQTWGWYEGAVLESAIFVGANLMPICCNPDARSAFAARLNRMRRRSSAIVGDAEEVLDLWALIENSWGPAREIRAEQPLMVITKSVLDADSLVRLVEPVELDQLLPASIAMFTEEVGVSPVAGGRAAAFRARVGASIRQGRTYARFEGREVIFKAEVGSVSAHSAQVQGVWVTPRLRGHRLSAPALAAVVDAALRDHAPRVSLYANSHNAVALRTYARVGFEQIGTFATVLF